MTPLFLYLQQYFLPVTVLAKSFTESVRVEIFRDEVYIVRNTVKRKENLDVWLLSEEKKAPMTSKFHLIVVSIFLKMCERSGR